MEKLLNEAEQLGISTVITAGGEPFIREDLINITSKFKNILFPVFTNGLLLSTEKINRIKNLKNILPIISLEGHKRLTDDRRGDGVYDKVFKTLSLLKSKNILFGISITMTCKNYDHITSHEFIKGIINMGCKIIFYIDYIPFEEGTKNLELNDSLRRNMPSLIERLRKKYPAMFISFPGDESEFGGCLSAGRGFIHVGSDGSIEPCPFAPYSKDNIENVTLREALRSTFMENIRNNHEMLSEDTGGCALFKNKEWVKQLAEEN